MTGLDHPGRYAAALAVLLVLLAVVIGVAVLGGGDDGSEAGGAPIASGPADGDVRSGGEVGPADATSGGRGSPGTAGDGGGPRDGGSAGAKGGGGAGPTSGQVDLRVRPGSIRGARVTETGAVQTLPPDEGAHDTAQENTYPSIRSFGEEASGEEATNITFALVQYLTAKAEDDWATACARLYSVLRENLERLRDGGTRPCPEAYGELMSRSSKERRIEQAKIDISSVRRGVGNRAFVIYKTPETLSADMPMYVEEGIWKVGALEAYALTPDQVG
jgi:hypothetical protein